MLGAVRPIELHGRPGREKHPDLLADEQPGRDPERDGSERRRHIDAGQRYAGIGKAERRGCRPHSGSPTAMTTGIVLVAFFAAKAAGVPCDDQINIESDQLGEERGTGLSCLPTRSRRAATLTERQLSRSLS